ncbi:MAG: hypothetical protein HYZ27_03405 [Deltaproteobacteria bacterium]|nr:hypothetical protein [Deltaproteobacteria bacterium]
MKLAAHQLFALHGVLKELGGAGSVRSLKVDGQAVSDPAAAVRQAEQEFSAMVEAVRGSAKVGSDKGFMERMADGLADKIDRFEKSSALTYGRVREVYDKVVEPMREQPGELVRHSEVEVELRNGSRFRQSVAVVDVPQTLANARVDAATLTAAGAPLPLPPPFGYLQGIGVPLVSAVMVALRARSARRQGQHEEARALEELAARHRLLARYGAVPVASSLVAAYALVHSRKHSDQLKHVVSIDEIVRLGVRA